MNKRAFTLSSISLVLALAVTPAAMASMADVSAGFTGRTLENVTDFTITNSYSEVAVWNSSPASDELSDGGTVATSVTVAIPGASGSARTDNTPSLHAFAESVARPAAGLSSGSGDNYAGYEWAFTATGTVSFSFDLDFDMTLKTLAPGESANGEIYFLAQMWSDSTNNYWSQEWELPKSVADGKDFERSLTNTFSGMLFMENGETGHGSLYIGTYAEATSVVPVPAAVLLGFLGLGAAGVGLRKLA